MISYDLLKSITALCKKYNIEAFKGMKISREEGTNL
jgi:hypothetical protein